MNPIAAFIRSRNKRRSLMRLRDLDAHLLADIGVSPDDVRRLTGRQPMLDLFGGRDR
jgi:uncharacterized protein YjiS (DUF1127 family)